MNDFEILEALGSVPVTYGALRSLYADYKSPADKISELSKAGILIRLKRGLYTVSPKVSRKPTEKMLLANHLYGPSYVSLSTALEVHGLIPEGVYVTQSVTPKRTQTFATPIGYFSYASLPGEYYRIGVRQAVSANGNHFLIASPEKALCDTIVKAKKLQIRSRKAMRLYLEDDLRIDPELLSGFDADVIAACEDAGRKSAGLRYLREVIDEQRS
jgi:hypothetical protein